MLTGAGGTGKSTLASDIALAVAGEKPPLLSPIEAVGSGEVLWVSFEERLGRIAARMKARVGENDPAIGRIRGVALGGRPMFGPAETKGGGAFYNARPKALPGWDAIDAEIDLMREPPRLVVLDPALAAFVGEPNAASPVREFITELKTRIAEKYGCAVLLIGACDEERSSWAVRPHSGWRIGRVDRCASRLPDADPWQWRQRRRPRRTNSRRAEGECGSGVHLDTAHPRATCGQVDRRLQDDVRPLAGQGRVEGNEEAKGTGARERCESERCRTAREWGCDERCRTRPKERRHSE